MHVTSEESVKAYRSVPTSCLDPVESKLGFSHLSIFSHSPERAARAAPNGVKKGATFLLLFRSLNHTDSSRKPFNGFRRAKFTQRNTNIQKYIFVDDRLRGHHPRALKAEQDEGTLTQKKTSRRKRKKQPKPAIWMTRHWIVCA